MFPFGLGKRVCMGENLAKRELFIITTMLLNQYEIGISKKSQCPDLKNYKGGVVLTPLPFHVELTPRD